MAPVGLVPQNAHYDVNPRSSGGWSRRPAPSAEVPEMGDRHRKGESAISPENWSALSCGYVSELSSAYKDEPTNSVWISILEVNDLCTGQRLAISKSLCRCSADGWPS